MLMTAAYFFLLLHQYILNHLKEYNVFICMTLKIDATHKHVAEDDAGSKLRIFSELNH